MIREIGSSSPGMGSKDHEIRLQGTKEEMDAIRAMLTGATWLSIQKVEEGGAELKRSEVYKPAPAPEDDPLIPPKWQLSDKAGVGDPKTGAGIPKLREFVEPGEGWHCPSFYMTSLCGYNYTPELYKATAQRLQTYGFECLRSRRGPDGRYWEVWYLAGDWAARGDLKKFLTEKKFKSEQWQEMTRAVCEWLAHRVSFGSLNVDVQRMAMAVPD